MIDRLKKFMLWVYSIEPGGLLRSSWMNESLAGFAGGIVFMLLLHGSAVWTFLVFNLVSVLYERFVDPNGWSWSDVLSRVPGLILAIVIFVTLQKVA
jgi:hypothetical protein